MMPIILTAALWELTFPKACLSSGWQLKCSHCTELPKHIKISKYSILYQNSDDSLPYELSFPMSQEVTPVCSQRRPQKHCKSQPKRTASETSPGHSKFICRNWMWEPQLCTLPPPLPKGLLLKRTAFKGLGYSSDQSLGLFWSSCCNPTHPCPQWHTLVDTATGQRRNSSLLGLGRQQAICRCLTWPFFSTKHSRSQERRQRQDQLPQLHFAMVLALNRGPGSLQQAKSEQKEEKQFDGQSILKMKDSEITPSTASTEISRWSTSEKH